MAILPQSKFIHGSYMYYRRGSSLASLGASAFENRWLYCVMWYLLLLLHILPCLFSDT